MSGGGPVTDMHLRTGLFAPVEARFLDEIERVNAYRVKVVTRVLVPVHLIHLVVFGMLPPTSTNATWRAGVLLVHGTLLTLDVVAQVLAIRAPHRPDGGVRVGRVLGPALGFLYLVFGALLTTIDSWVGQGPIAYAVVCTGVGIALLWRPALAIVAYAVALAAIELLLSLTIQSSDLLLSTRVNCLAATALGLTGAFVFWRTYLDNLRQRREIELQRQELEALATRDPLTHLFNRRHFVQLAEVEIARARRTGRPLCVVMIDVDHFKEINDRFGHVVGDEVLQGVAAVLRGAIRATDVVARVGGEEFVVLLPETTLDGALESAERLRRVAAASDLRCAGEPVAVTVSCGVSAVSLDEDDPLAVAMRRADAALYRAKRGGRDRVEH